MAGTVKENAGILLGTLYDDSKKKDYCEEVSGEMLHDLTKLAPNEVNDAASVLVDNGYAEWLQEMGTHPYDFSNIIITPRGKVEYERAVEEARVKTESPSRAL